MRRTAACLVFQRHGQRDRHRRAAGRLHPVTGRGHRRCRQGDEADRHRHGSTRRRHLLTSGDADGVGVTDDPPPTSTARILGTHAKTLTVKNMTTADEDAYDCLLTIGTVEQSAGDAVVTVRLHEARHPDLGVPPRI